MPRNQVVSGRAVGRGGVLPRAVVGVRPGRETFVAGGRYGLLPPLAARPRRTMLLLIRSRLVLLVLGGLGFLAPGCSPPKPGGDPPPPGFSLRDVAGVEHHPFTDPA